ARGRRSCWRCRSSECLPRRSASGPGRAGRSATWSPSRSPASSKRRGSTLEDALVNPVQSEQLARRLASLADSKKAEDVIALDMRDLVTYTDFLVICSARNERQAGAIVDEVRVRVKRDSGLLPGGVDAGGDAGW